MDEFLTGLGKVFVVLTIILLIGALLAFPIMLLWNYTMVDFGLPRIDVWHALALMVLSKLLLSPITYKDTK